MARTARTVAVCLAGLVALCPGSFASDSSGPATLAQALLRGDGKVVRGRARGVEAGTFLGRPYLMNEKVVFIWAKPEAGAGLLSIYDRVAGKELLEAAGPHASLWQIDVKRGEKKEKASYESAGAPCKARFSARFGVGTVLFKWGKDLGVEVKTRLAAGESLARSVMKVRVKRRDEGLLTVTYPVVKGILPFTEDAKGDEILHTFRLGWTKPSPLVSGKEVKLKYPLGLQLTTLMAGGRGLYFSEEDERANEKLFRWQADAESGTLTFTLAHPVLDWGGDKPVTRYQTPGDIVMGPFQGDWFDAARIYRKWALTAPWSRKGPIHKRKDTPKWLTRVPYWSVGGFSSEEGIEKEIVKQEFLGVPEMVFHDYWYSVNRYQHDRNPEYFPPRIGSENYKRAVEQMHERGIRVIPYVIGWLWNMSTESYRLEDAEKLGTMFGPKGGMYWTWAGGLDPQAAMCPATSIWRRKMVDVSTELVGRYGHDGVYFDYFTQHACDCFVKTHGHPLGGGNYWTKAVRGFYEDVRRECKRLNPDAMLCAEDAAEWCIDLVDASYDGGPYANAPVFLAVYHGYYQVFGGIHNKTRPEYLGRWWLMGCISGPTNQMNSFARPTSEYVKKIGLWYRDLIRCQWEFARPYLGHGEMLRPPKIEGDVPTITAKGAYGPFTVRSVDGSAWRAPDGSVGIFFLNYDREKGYEFTWTEDLNEFARLGPEQKLEVTRWVAGEGEKPLGEWQGGVVTRTMKIEPLGLIALKLRRRR